MIPSGSMLWWFAVTGLFLCIDVPRFWPSAEHGPHQPSWVTCKKINKSLQTAAKVIVLIKNTVYCTVSPVFFFILRPAVYDSERSNADAEAEETCKYTCIYIGSSVSNTVYESSFHNVYLTKRLWITSCSCHAESVCARLRAEHVQCR